MRLVLIGLVAGLFSSLFGVGGGIVIVPLLIMVVGFGPRQATATSLGAIVITAVAGVALCRPRGGRRRYALLVGHPGCRRRDAGDGAPAGVSGRALTLAFAGFSPPSGSG